MGPLNLSWIREGELAVSGRPQGLQDLLRLREAGVDAVVSMTPRANSPSDFDECGLAWLHVPLEDFTAPSLEQIRAFVEFVQGQRALGRATLVHCSAGLGRSGTMAACYLVARGLDPGSALEEIRVLRPGSVETNEQEKAVQAWAAHLRTRSAEAE